MKKPAEFGAIDIAAVQSRMLTIRNQQVLLDRDVAALYGVQTKEINQAIRNNPGKFPEGFVFQLNEDEFENWKSKILTSNLSAREIAVIKMGIRRAPYALTERGLVPDPKRLRRASFAGGVLASCRQIQAFSCDV